jgi:N-sulfoglucosamine sulfohydrolase
VKYQPKDINVPTWLPDQPEVRQELAEYYQAISRMDQGIGLLLDAIRDTGHWDDTLIMFLSDNGPPFPGAKTTMYQPGINLPLLVRDPRLKTQGKTTEAMATWADLTPTILDYCGVEPKPVPPVRPSENTGKRATAGKPQPYKFHGRSFLKILDQEHPQGWDEMYASHTFHEITMYYPMRTIIRGNYKYIINLAHGLPYPFASDLHASPTWQASLKRGDKIYGLRTVEAYIHRPRHELYDLSADPNELHNLADDSKHKAILSELQEKLKNFQKTTRDPWISKYDYE